MMIPADSASPRLEVIARPLADVPVRGPLRLSPDQSTTHARHWWGMRGNKRVEWQQ